jgi:hypothetical protein
MTLFLVYCHRWQEKRRRASPYSLTDEKMFEHGAGGWMPTSLVLHASLRLIQVVLGRLVAHTQKKSPGRSPGLFLEFS